MGKTLVLIATCALMICACVGDMKTMEKGDPSAPRKVLVVAAESGYKVKLIETMIARLGTNGFYYKITGFAGLETEDLAPYGAIVIAAPLVAGRIDAQASAVCQKHSTDARIIAFVTTGTEHSLQDKMRSALPADAVSAASAMERVDERAEELVALIRKRF
jgi:hypothetical protein